MKRPHSILSSLRSTLAGAAGIESQLLAGSLPSWTVPDATVKHTSAREGEGEGEGEGSQVRSLVLPYHSLYDISLQTETSVEKLRKWKCPKPFTYPVSTKCSHRGSTEQDRQNTMLTARSNPHRLVNLVREVFYNPPLTQPQHFHTAISSTNQLQGKRGGMGG